MNKIKKEYLVNVDMHWSIGLRSKSLFRNRSKTPCMGEIQKESSEEMFRDLGR